MPRKFRWQTFDAISLKEDWQTFLRSSECLELQRDSPGKDLSDGACFGLSEKWMQQISECPDQTAVERADAIVTALPVAAATQVHYSGVWQEFRAKKMHTGRDWNEALNEGSKGAGLKFKVVQVFNEPTTIPAVLSDKLAKGSDGSIYSLFCDFKRSQDGERTNHIVALQAGNSFRFFDPNIGEIEANKLWLQQLIYGWVNHNESHGLVFNSLKLFEVHLQVVEECKIEFA